MSSKYIISLGGQHKIFTLWYHYVIDQPDFFRENFYYMQNLAIDPDEAQKKADKIADGELVIWDVDGDYALNSYGIRASNEVFDGVSITYGKKFRGQKIEDVLDDEFGLQYVALKYGFPSKPRQCDLECMAYCISHPKVKKYFADLKKLEKKYDNFVNTIKQDIQMSDHIGTIGETIELDVTITDAFWVETRFGSSKCIKMIDSESNQICVFTNAGAFTDYDKACHPMDKMRIRAQVKRHDVRDHKLKANYNGKPQYLTIEDVNSTLVTRIKKLEGK